MSAGAVISINYDYLQKSFSPLNSSGNSDIFSSILDPLKKAKSIGKSIKTELGKIALELDVTTTIGKFLSSDDSTVNNLTSVSESAKLARNDEEVVYGALTNIEDKLVDFGNTVIDVDSKASGLISHRKLDFNQRYPWLESDSEYKTRMDQRSSWEKTGDFFHGFFKGGLVGGFDSLFNGREKFDQHYEAIKQKIAEFASNTWEWVKENWEAIVAAVVVVVAAIVAICTFGAGTVFLVASLAAFAYAVADKIVAINNNGKGIVATLEENGFHHLSQFFKGLNWGLQISMLISGFGMQGSSALTIFKGTGFLATVGNGAIFGGGYNFAVDFVAYLLNFGFSSDAQSNPLEYLKSAIKDTLVDTVSGFVVGGVVAGISYTAIKGFSFLRSKFNTSPNEVKIGDKFNISKNPDGTFEVNGKTLSRNEVINPETGEFYHKYGELEYNSDAVYSKSYNKKSAPRGNIQKDAVQSMLDNNPDYFKQFGCKESSADDIVEWFGDKERNPIYTLHETLNNKVQIVHRDLNKTVLHGGGNALEQVRIKAWDNYDEFISYALDCRSAMEGITVGDMKNIYNQYSNSLADPNNFNIDMLRGTKGKEKFLSDIMKFINH